MALEIERRWLVEQPDWIDEGGGPSKVKWLSITQHYLKSGKGIRRIRATTELSPGDSIVYHYTEKQLVSPGVNEEEEREIPFNAFLNFHKQVDPILRAIHKYRYVFTHKGLVFELDKFTKPVQMWVLECELPSLDHPCKLPPSIKVIKEITGIKELSNYGIASN